MKIAPTTKPAATAAARRPGAARPAGRAGRPAGPRRPQAQQGQNRPRMAGDQLQLGGRANAAQDKLKALMAQAAEKMKQKPEAKDAKKDVEDKQDLEGKGKDEMKPEGKDDLGDKLQAFKEKKLAAIKAEKGEALEGVGAER